MLDHEQPPRVYREPWPPYARDPFQGPAQPVAPEPSPWDGPRHGQARPAWRLWLPWLLPVTLAAAIAAVVLLVTQGGSPNGEATAANVKACQDYRAQGVRARAHPDLAGVTKAVVWVAADAAEAASGSRLHSDLASWSADPVSAHGRILADCAAVGVKAG